MTDSVVDSLVMDLLEWIGPTPRPQRDVLEVWRTSCPRLPVWEEAHERGFLQRRHEGGQGAFVSVSPAGREYLRRHRSPAPWVLTPDMPAQQR